MWPKEKLLIMSNFTFGHNVSKVVCCYCVKRWEMVQVFSKVICSKYVAKLSRKRVKKMEIYNIHEVPLPHHFYLFYSSLCQLHTTFYIWSRQSDRYDFSWFWPRFSKQNIWSYILNYISCVIIYLKKKEAVQSGNFI